MENGSIFLCTLKFDKTPLDKKPSKAQYFKAALLLPWYKAFLKSPRFSSFNSRQWKMLFVLFDIGKCSWTLVATVVFLGTPSTVQDLHRLANGDKFLS